MYFSDKTIFICCFFLMFIIIPIRIRNVENQQDFDEYLRKFNKSYNNLEEYTKHKNAFEASLIEINKLNSLRKDQDSALYGLTAYSDMTTNEFLNKHLQMNLGLGIQQRIQYEFKPYTTKRSVTNSLKLPLKIDWREFGIITDVNNQKFCGACWAFTVIENIEAMYALKSGNLSHFSVQEMIDCARYNNDGCNGGDMCRLLRWLKDGHIPIQTDSEYPLILETKDCKLNRTAAGLHISKFICKNLSHDENMMLSIIANDGPVVVAINALTWQNYLGGVIQYHCNDSPFLLNHAVQIVGYDLSAEIPHYIVRNSWGHEFGDNGYLYVSIGKNTCGIATEVIALSIL